MSCRTRITRYGIFMVVVLSLGSGIFLAIRYFGQPAGEYTPETRLVLQTGHQDKVTCVAFSPDGQLLASGSFDQTIRLWDVRTGRLVRTLRGPIDGVRFVGFGSEGHSVVAGSPHGAVIVWDIQSGLRQRAWNVYVSGRPTAESYAYALSVDGLWLACSGSSGDVRIWELATGQLARSFESDLIAGGGLLGHVTDVTALAFSPARNRLVSGDRDGLICLWDTSKRRGLFEPKPRTADRPLRSWAEHNGSITSISFTSDGSRFYAVDMTQKLCLFETDGGLVKPATEYQSRSPGVVCAAEGQVLLTDIKARRITVLNGADLSPNRYFELHNTPVSIKACPMLGVVAIGFVSRISVLSLESGEPRWESPPPLMPLKHVALSQRGDELCAVYARGVAIWNLSEQRRTMWRSSDQTSSLGCSFRDDGVPLVVRKRDDLAEGAVAVEPIRADMADPPTPSLVINAREEMQEPKLIDRRFLCRLPKDDRAGDCWDLTAPEPQRREIHLPRRHKLIAIAPGVRLVCTRKTEGIDPNKPFAIAYWAGRSVLVPWPEQLPQRSPAEKPASPNRQVRPLPEREPRPLQWIRFDGTVAATGGSPAGSTHVACFSTDAALMAWACESLKNSYVGHDRFSCSDLSGPTDNEIHVWDTNTGACLQRLADDEIEQYHLRRHAPEAHRGGTLAAAFSPDGSHLVSGGTDGDVKIWNLASDRIEQRLSVATRAVTDVLYVPTGMRIVATGEDSVVRLWDLRTGRCASFVVFANGQWLSVGLDGVVRASEKVEQSMKIQLEEP